MSEPKRLGERLVEAGVLTPDQLESALAQQQRKGGRLGEVLLRAKVVDEITLLRVLALQLNTRYVSTEKLAKVRIPSAILERIPVRVAEQAVVLPILWDERQRILSVVMAEPQDLAVAEELRLVSESETVQTYLATRLAVVAGVRKHYYGDITAFADFELGPARPRDDAYGTLGPAGHNMSGLSEVPTESLPGFRTTGTAPTGVRATLDELRAGSLPSDNDFIETLNVLVGLLELSRPELKGHSALVARLTRGLSQRLALTEREINHHTIAAYLHDLGKRTDAHLTLIKTAEDGLLRTEAGRHYRTPLRLFETVHLPVEVTRILTQLYEAWDGTGLPEGAAGADIALGARIIAAVDAYVDLTSIPAPDGTQPMDRAAALDELGAYAGTLLDPEVVHRLVQTVAGDLP